MKNIPKDTNYYHYYNANSHNKIAGDCVVRALCTAMQKTWEEVYTDLCKIGIKYGYMPNDRRVINRYLKSQGWIKLKTPFKDEIKKTKLKAFEFCCNLQSPDVEYVLPITKEQSLKIIANIGSEHMAAIIEGKVNDIWDCTNRCVGNYWVKG